MFISGLIGIPRSKAAVEVVVENNKIRAIAD